MEDLSGILISDEVKEAKIEHEGKEYKFRFKELPWARVTSILSRCMRLERNQVITDMAEFYIKYLEEALVEAPWPVAQTRLYVGKLDRKFGAKLTKYLPSPFEEEESEALKKE